MSRYLPIAHELFGSPETRARALHAMTPGALPSAKIYSLRRQPVVSLAEVRSRRAEARAGESA